MLFNLVSHHELSGQAIHELKVKQFMSLAVKRSTSLAGIQRSIP